MGVIPPHARDGALVPAEREERDCASTKGDTALGKAHDALARLRADLDHTHEDGAPPSAGTGGRGAPDCERTMVCATGGFVVRAHKSAEYRSAYSG